MAAFISRILGVFLCFVTFNLYADVADSSTGVTFPSQVTVEHDGKQYKLQATGTATRKKFFVKVYSVASYIQEGALTGSGDKFQPFMSDEFAKQLTLKWVHEASPEKVQEGYQESFKNALSSAEYSNMQNAIDQYIHLFNQPVQKGDEQIIRWFPGGYVEVVFNGKTIGSITNPDFARVLWSIWFGNKSVVDRNQLVSGLK